MASDRLLPGARLNEIVVATNRPWWLTCTGALPGSIRAKAESGTIVSLAAETGALDEAPPLLAAMALAEALRAESDAMAAAFEAVSAVLAAAAAVAATAPAPPEVLPTAPVPRGRAGRRGGRCPGCWCRWPRWC